jgi:hypothetical protein
MEYIFASWHDIAGCFELITKENLSVLYIV